MKSTVECAVYQVYGQYSCRETVPKYHMYMCRARVTSQAGGIACL